MMRQSEQDLYIATRILEQLPPTMQATLDTNQIVLLQKALVKYRRSRHMVDIRLPIPFPGGGLYVVFLLGRNQRARENLRADRQAKTKGLLGRATLMASILVGCSAIVGLSQLYRLFSTSIHNQPVIERGPNFHPAEIPFKRNKQECEISGRQWKESQCIDAEHDPTF
ncbi:MAG: hypothetical protein AAF152_01295 [Cyanobacteria bacterium P01_A01_bin.114]